MQIESAAADRSGGKIRNHVNRLQKDVFEFQCDLCWVLVEERCKVFAGDVVKKRDGTGNMRRGH